MVRLGLFGKNRHLLINISYVFWAGSGVDSFGPVPRASTEPFQSYGGLLRFNRFKSLAVPCCTRVNYSASLLPIASNSSDASLLLSSSIPGVCFRTRKYCALTFLGYIPTSAWKWTLVDSRVGTLSFLPSEWSQTVVTGLILTAVPLHPVVRTTTIRSYKGVDGRDVALCAHYAHAKFTRLDDEL